MQFLLTTGLIAATLTGAALQAQNPSQPNRTGMAAIGFSAFSPADVDQSASSFAACPASTSCEIAVLAYSFGGFENLDRFVRAVLPAYRNNQTLVVTVYLDDGANRDNNADWCWFRKGTSATSFWTAVRNNDLVFKRDWQNQVASPYGTFATRIRAWANMKGLGSRLSLVVVPVLEDGNNGANIAPGWAYQRLIEWTTAVIPANIGIRRNSTASTADRIPGAAMEFHRDRVGSLIRGDVITADGVRNGQGFTDDTEWIGFQRQVLSRSASALFWWPSFNGPRTGPPWTRGTLRPLTSNANNAGRVRRILSSR